MGCALEMVYWREGLDSNINTLDSNSNSSDTERDPSEKVERKLLWLLGGEGGYSNRSNM